MSAKFHYGLRAMVVMAQHPDKPIPAARFADDEAISAPYLGQILNELRNAGLLHGERGRNGGLRLARPATEISMADLVRALNIWAVEVSRSGTHGEVEARLSHLWERLDAAMTEVLRSVSLADIALGSGAGFPPALTTGLVSVPRVADGLPEATESARGEPG